MTLDETIKEFTDWAKDNRKEQNFWAAERDENDETNPLSYADCEGLARDAETRAEYHEQLAEWLTELKEAKRLLKAAVKDINSYVDCYEAHCDECCCIYDNHCHWKHEAEALKLLEKG